MKVKQVIVLRNDLKIRKGKAAVQAAHASLSSFLKLQDIYYSCLRNYSSDPLSLAKGELPGNADHRTREIRDVLDQWLQNGQAKICLKVESEEALIATFDKFRSSVIPSVLITDAGHTEFKEPTKTAVAIGPWWSEAIDPVTGVLGLM